MATIHISAAEAARDFSELLERVRAGAEVMIEDGPVTVAVLHAPAPPRRTLSESIAMAEERTKRLGYKPVLDVDYSADEEIIRNRKPRISKWD